ncbi:MAG: TIGR00304 family membrane protein [Candidatus Bathyarchaeales archaeon]
MPNITGENKLTQFASKLFLYGFILIFVGTALILIANIFTENHASTGGVIIIGPIPIIFGSGEDFWFAIFVGIVFTVVSVVLYFLLRRR